MKLLHIRFVVALLCMLCCQPLFAQDDKNPGKDNDPQAGHSYHGEVFNEGPRQAAYLMGGTGKVHFPVSSKVPKVQAFIDQGVGQLHGFWYFEAERSFRQAAMLDPNCAIAYWGMAMANEGNLKRAKGFIAEAMKRKANCSDRERRYIEVLNEFFNSEAKNNTKAKTLVEGLEGIAKDYTDDTEALAFLGYYLYKFRGDLKKSYEDVEAVCNQVLEREPLHPVHHYIIHLWDYKDAKKALKSSALCGEGSPSVAHMWHMPGHIYSRLKRYEDAVWQQEASARVDHKHMMHDRVLPDQIHNFAHNNEWLIRNLIFIGKHKDALDLAMNMTELPRHPKYNTLKGRNSANYGRQRLFEVLSQFELWNDLIKLTSSTHLEPTDDTEEQIKRLRYLGIAYASTKNSAGMQGVLDDLQQRLGTLRTELAKKEEESRPAKAKEREGGDASKDNRTKEAAKDTQQNADKQAKNAKEATASKPAGKRNQRSGAKGRQGGKGTENKTLRALEQAVDAIKGFDAAAKGEYKNALELLRKSGEDAMVLARLQVLSGQKEQALKSAQAHVRSHQKEVLPLARLIEIQWLAGEKLEAAKSFNQLREISGSVQFGSPVFDRLAPIAKALDLPEDWRIKRPHPEDFGTRPNLDDLGPFRWRPMPAPEFALTAASGKVRSLEDYRGKPVIVIFYLGYGCLHCAEQLNAFAPKTEAFRRAGIELIAISTDDLEGLKISLKNYKGGEFPFPLVANPQHDVFKAYRAYDDFENMPLHGTFLIDEHGRVRWQDISYEPFMDVEFVLKESQRLLGLDRTNAGNAAARP